MRQILFLALLLFLSGEASAQLFSGRFVTTLYSYQQYDTTNSSKLSLRGYEAMQLNFGNSRYQLHSYLLATNDFLTRLSGDPRLRAANLYVEIRNLGDVFTLKLGRQPVFSRVGVSAVDGLSADARLIDDKVKITLFGGILPPYDESVKINSNIKNNNLIGAQASYSPVEGLSFTGSYVNKNFKPESYYALRRDTLGSPSDVRTVLVDPSSVANQFVSGDIFYYNEKASGYLRVDYDLNFSKFNRTEASLRYSIFRPLVLNVEYFHRDSRLPFNSIFSVFDHSGTDEYDIGVNYLFASDITFFVSAGKVYYTGDNASQISVGGTYRLFSITYSHNDGFAGNLNGVSAQILYPLFNRKLILIGAASFSDYRYLQGQSDLTRIYSGTLGLTFRPMSLLSFDIQAQYLRNPVYLNDMRGYLRVNYYFFRNLAWFSKGE
ncbi:MAG: hypothetical protein ACP5US_03190 [Candidatus Kryptoniota bacterium]